MSSCVITGSFDPITVGHMDLIKRARALFDTVTVCVLSNSEKKNMFTPKQRLDSVICAISGIEGCHAAAYDGLTADFVLECGADCIVRGYRNASDAEYEAELCAINSRLCGKDTVLLPSSPSLSFISSTFVRELFKYKRDPSPYLPDGVYKILVPDRKA